MAFSPIQLEKLKPAEYTYRGPEILELYKENPTLFEKNFSEALPRIDPKVLRLLAYHFYTEGISVGKFFHPEHVPEFLYYLNQFPLESLLVLLKYDFPHVFQGNLFLTYSLDTSVSDACLSLCEHMNADLNHQNESGMTTLSEAVVRGDLNMIDLLLKHRADPSIKNTDGSTPLLLAVSGSSNLQIIRDLSRYGAPVDRQVQKAMNNNPKIMNAILTGDQMTAYYAPINKDYYNLDSTEDLALIAVTNPSVLTDEKYLSELGPVNLEMLKQSVQNVNDQTAITENYILTWPYYIDDTVITPCRVEPDTRATVDSPPGPEKVYEYALENLPDSSPMQPQPAQIVIVSENRQEPWSHALYP